MIRSVLIDFDDTLCPTEADGFLFENAVLACMGRKPQPRSVHKKTWGQPLFEAIKVRSPGIDVERFRMLAQDILPGWVNAGRIDAVPSRNLEALDRLKERGLSVYVVTSRVRLEMEHLLSSEHVLTSRIGAFYYHEVLAYHKPDPRTFDTVLDTHGLARQECVYVGDSPGDAAAATQAGLTFIATLESRLRVKEDFASWPVACFIDQFASLPAAVAALQRQQDKAILKPMNEVLFATH